VSLARGSAIIEVDQLITGTHLAVEINGVSAQVDKKGLYAFDTARQSVSVLDGKLTVLQGSKKQTLGKHDQVLLASDRPLKKRGFDQKSIETEPLYVWSKVRSQDESRANEVAASDPNPYTVASTGWYWDPYAGFYGFWPADGFLYSPFGWGFYSPLYFGYGGGYGWYGRPGGWRGHPGTWHGTAPGTTVRAGAFHTGAVHAVGGFRAASGGFGGFHGGGGFHAGGHR
jgi:hypothetical protein